MFVGGQLSKDVCLCLFLIVQTMSLGGCKVKYLGVPGLIKRLEILLDAICTALYLYHLVTEKFILIILGSGRAGIRNCTCLNPL